MSAKAKSPTPPPVSQAISEEARVDAQQDLIVEVQYVLEAVLRDKKLTRREIAARLNKSEATISRALDGASNLRLKTIADIATALGDRFHVSSRHFEQMKDANKVNSMYGPPATAATYGITSAADFLMSAMMLGGLHKLPHQGRVAVGPSTKGSAFIEVGGARQQAGIWSCKFQQADDDDIVATNVGYDLTAKSWP